MRSLGFGLLIFSTIFVSSSYGSEGGMPQLNTEFWVAQVFWLILIFFSLYALIWKIFLPKITFSLENRKSRIINDINEAQKLKETAEKKLKEYKNKIENAKIEAKKLIEEERKKLDSNIENKRKKINEEIDKEISKVEKEIKELKKNSVPNINKVAVEISSEIIKKIVGSNANSSNVSAIVSDISKKKLEKYL